MGPKAMNNILKFAAFAFLGIMICAIIPDGKKGLFPPITQEAIAQSIGQLQAGQVWGNPTNAQTYGEPTTVGALLDQEYSCTAQGSIIERGASLWGCLGPGASGLPLVSQGAGANLHYAALANAALVNSSVTLGSTNVALGATVTTFAGIILTTPTINGASFTGTISGTPTYSGTNFITLANIAQDSTAWSFLGNASSGTANYAPFTVGSLTTKASPVNADTIIIADSAASGALKQATVGSIASAGSVSSVNLQTGAVVLWPFPQGRLTLTSGVPVMATSVSGATTVYYTAYAGKNVPIYNGTAVAVYQLCTANTVGACQLSAVLGSNWAANTNYDWYIALSGGSPVLCSGPAWASSTSRGTGAGTTQLAQLDGLNTNAVSMTCRTSNSTTISVAANQGTFVATMQTGSAGQTNFIFGASAAGGTAGSFGIWNAYNRITIRTTVNDSNVNWTYTSVTIRPADGSTNNSVSFLSGLSEDGFSCNYINVIEIVASAGNLNIGCALDNIAAYDRKNVVLGAASTFFSVNVKNDYNPVLGWHTVTALENGDGTNANASAGATNEAFIFEFQM